MNEARGLVEQSNMQGSLMAPAGGKDMWSASDGQQHIPAGNAPTRNLRSAMQSAHGASS